MLRSFLSINYDKNDSCRPSPTTDRLMGEHSMSPTHPNWHRTSTPLPLPLPLPRLSRHLLELGGTLSIIRRNQAKDKAIWDWRTSCHSRPTPTTDGRLRGSHTSKGNGILAPLRCAEINLYSNSVPSKSRELLPWQPLSVLRTKSQLGFIQKTKKARK